MHMKQLDQTFAALADPMRRKLLINLAENSPKTVTQLAREYPITRQGILKHLHILTDAGLVAVHQQGRDKRYTLTPEPLSELAISSPLPPGMFISSNNTSGQRLLRYSRSAGKEATSSTFIPACSSRTCRKPRRTMG